MEDVEKIVDAELLALLAGRPGTASVLIEVEVSSPTVEMVPAPEGSIGRWSPACVVAPDGDGSIAEANREIVRSLVHRLVGRAPVWINASNTFVAELDGDQIRHLSRSPAVAHLYANRTLR